MATPSKRIEPVLPGKTNQPDEITCPHCGSFVGALTKCPNCGAPVHKSMRVRLFRYAALLLATVGLFLLYLMSIHKEIPEIQIGDISGTMNFGYVRIRGQVPAAARVYKEGDTVTGVRFSINDGTGVLTVRAYGAKGAALAAADKIPMAGDSIDVVGSLNVSAEDQVMYVQSPEHVQIERVPVASAQLDEITEDLVGQTIRTEGTVARISEPRGGSKRPYVLSLMHNNTLRDLVIWQSIFTEWNDSKNLALGDTVKVKVEVTEYRGRIQLTVSRAADLERIPGDGLPADAAPVSPSRPLSEPSAETVITEATPISHIQREHLNKTVAVKGRLTGSRTIRGGVVYTVTDESGEIETVIWENRIQGPVLNRMQEGAEIWLRGRVDEYRERLQIIPRQADDINIM